MYRGFPKDQCSGAGLRQSEHTSAEEARSDSEGLMSMQITGPLCPCRIWLFVALVALIEAIISN